MTKFSLRSGTTLSVLAGVLLAFPLQATTLSVALDIQGQGLSMADGGVGLIGLGGTMDSRDLNVTIGGPVQAALLYWAGRDRPCPLATANCVVPFQPYKDQVLRFEGSLITGTIIGTEQQPSTPDGPVNNIGFLADVTSIVQTAGTGAQTFSIEDGDAASNLFRLEGAGLLVIYTDAADTNVYRIIVFDGLDFAYGADTTAGASQTTVPVVFNHGAEGSARSASLLLFVGGGAAGPDRVDFSNDPSVVNSLNATDGAAWDTDLLAVNVPAGVGSTSVQVLSTPADQSPDQLLWETAILRIIVGGQVAEQTATPTNTPTVTPTITPTSTRTATPTATPTRTATSTSTPLAAPAIPALSGSGGAALVMLLLGLGLMYVVRTGGRSG